MKLKTLQKALVVGVFAMTSGYAMQASADPIFSFTEYGGFSPDVAPGVVYSGAVNDPLSHPTTVYNTMSWVAGQTPQSSLVLSTVTGPAALPENTWTTISTLTHNNIVIPSAFNWSDQDVWGRFIITDSNGGPSVRLDSDDAITLSFTETPNAAPCPFPNPNSSTCDDYFAFTASGLDSLGFSANDGSHWVADFRLADLTNAIQIGNTVYTAEGQTSFLHVQALVRQVPEPATLTLMGLGLLGLGFAKR
ncbi:MAG: THxN family PEP-CTERM protein, partial [Sulfuricella sp.]